MHKKISAVFLFIFLTGNTVFAQAPEDSWNIGFGVSYLDYSVYGAVLIQAMKVMVLLPQSKEILPNMSD